MSKTVAVDTEKNGNLCYGVTMMNKETMTTSNAIAILCDKYDATYRGTKTVREMTTSLTDAIMWEDESPATVYHKFETKIGPNTIVRDDQLCKLAAHYA